MGIESYLIADAVVGVIAQRLVRRVCTHCSSERVATPEEKELLGVPENELLHIWEAHQGECMHCGGSGYHGRIGIYEIMPVTQPIKQIITKGGTIEEIQEAALKEGMETLKMKAAKYVMSGLTTMEELKRIVYED
jgi:type IV pilus assembly protein PilB